jgi:hypothetical protein
MNVMGRKTLVITDVTRMRGNHVCIAGYDDSLVCVRPDLSAGRLEKRHLFKDGRLIVYPGARVSMNILYHRPKPPHIEDYVFEDGSIEYLGGTTVDEWEKILKGSVGGTFASVFPDMQGKAVSAGSSGPSMGTLVVEGQSLSISPECTSNSVSMKLDIADCTGESKRNVPITDLAFLDFLNDVCNKFGRDWWKTISFIEEELNKGQIYIRFGLSRPFSPQGDNNMRCWLMVTGVHTFPDLHGGDYTKRIKLEQA